MFLLKFLILLFVLKKEIGHVNKTCIFFDGKLISKEGTETFGFKKKKIGRRYVYRCARVCMLTSAHTEILTKIKY